MKFAYLTLFMAILMAGCAMYFSVVGMMAIFSGAATSVMIMMIILETSKLVGAAWLHRNWKDAPILLKSYMTFAVIVLMFITSLGIFGGLSKAHIEQGAPVGDNLALIERLDQRIAREQTKIDDAELVISQLDQAVQTLIDYDRIRGPEGSIAVRQSQAEERDVLNSIITQAQSIQDDLKDQRFILSSEVREFEVKVGPIKYVADLLYGDSSSQSLETAVQWLIITIIFVFDPFAVLLLIAANRTLIQSESHSSQETSHTRINNHESIVDNNDNNINDEPQNVLPVDPGVRDRIAQLQIALEKQRVTRAKQKDKLLGVQGRKINKD